MIFASDLIDPWSVAAAILAGIVAPLVLFWFYRNAPQPDPQPTPALMAWTVSVSLAWWGFVFYALQTAAAVGSDDPFWPRVFGRFGLYLIACTSFGITSAVIVHRRRR